MINVVISGRQAPKILFLSAVPVPVPVTRPYSLNYMDGREEPADEKQLSPCAD